MSTLGELKNIPRNILQRGLASPTNNIPRQKSSSKERTFRFGIFAGEQTGEPPSPNLNCITKDKALANINRMPARELWHREWAEGGTTERIRTPKSLDALNVKNDGYNLKQVMASSTSRGIFF
jgi:hypothetical protein